MLDKNGGIPLLRYSMRATQPCQLLGAACNKNPPVTIPNSKKAALYFPYLLSPDPLTGQPINPVTGSLNEIPPSATVAGVFAATDVSRGVWKAPAGFQAITRNSTGVVERGRMTDQRQGLLNPIGVDCLRDFPNIGTTVFGARTLVTLTDEQWRYVPVRRMALFLKSRYRRLTQHLLPGGPLRPYPCRSLSGWTAPAFVGAFGNPG
jgi:phage tail sheath protein FI